jgi:spoIIIJ-associated protein
MEKRYKAKSIDECVKNALGDLGVSEEEIDYEVIQEPSRGFFGLGAKEAEISVKLNDMYNVNLIKRFLSTLMGYYGATYTLEVEPIRSMSVYSVKVKSEESLSELIGKHGHTLIEQEKRSSCFGFCGC